ncbi:GH25 family lysozyme [Clostridium scatologenes]|uniref:Autolytic lysozyme n=1 Tax=Clostridium scatologenes TaxID=1548 RepID=A0A0E3MBY3_CLOSL|nr:GH25 family lysozyme [Clostridium scatologenes]AKA71975.1 autolytic lysozyme [Clostridium scatologenes]
MLKGIDINSENNILDWQQVLNDGIQVLINKATEGNYYQDRYFEYRYKNVRPLEIKFGCYHFASKHGAATEAQYFADFIKNYELDTILWLDIEQPPESYGWTWTGNNPSEYVNEFIPYIEKLTNIECGIYTGECFYKDFLQGKISSNIKLWIAKYSSNEPIGYPTNSWQYSETGTVAGAEQANSIDMDLFNENILLSSGGTKKVKNVICVNNSIDERAGKYLGDYLKCAVINNSEMAYDFSVAENVIGVGGGEFTTYIKKIIKGQDRYDTAQSVLNFIANGGK